MRIIYGNSTGIMVNKIGGTCGGSTACRGRQSVVFALQDEAATAVDVIFSHGDQEMETGMKSSIVRRSGTFPPTSLFLVAIAAVVVGVFGVSRRTATAAPPKVADQLEKSLAEFNRGAALMEQYKYVDAAKAFENVVKSSPGWTAARFNLGLAYFNMHGAAGAKRNLTTARDTFLKVLEFDPEHVHSLFCLGLYHQHIGENEEAVEYFREAYKRDADDPFVAYKYAVTLIGIGNNEEGTKVLERVVELDPGFISGIYRLAMQYNRLRQRDKAVKLLRRFQALKKTEVTGGSFTVGKTYGTIGKYYTVLGADNRPMRKIPAEPAARIAFSPRPKSLGSLATASWKWSDGTVDLPGIASADVDDDGDLDLCLTGMGEDGETAIWINDGKGGFRAKQTLAQGGVSPCFGDVDNDGDVDLWLGRVGADLFFENDGEGNFKDAELEAVAGPAVLTSTARLADFDSDGDLDLLAFRAAKGDVPAASRAAAPGSIFNNNRDGTYVDVAEALGLAMPEAAVSAVVYDDFDNDKDLDLIVFPADGKPIAWVNDRSGQFHLLDADATGLASTGVVGAITGDPDKDGDRDLLVFTGDSVTLHVNQGLFRFKTDEAFAAKFGPLGGTGGQFADMDNDGDLDLLIADAHRDGKRGPALLINDWPNKGFLDAEKVDPGNLFAGIRFSGNAGCVAADFTGNGKCDVLLVPVGKKPMLIENTTAGGNWIALDLRGIRGKEKKTRSNNSAIGARVEIKTGNVFQQYVVGVGCGPTAMPPLRVHAGLGRHTKVDWLRVIWPDAVLQAELELPGNRVVPVTELSRKTSSCPYLFVWDGERFKFVADFGGVGGLGYLVEPGVYAPPDPTEYLRLPPMKPKDGDYVLQALTPLEEVTYFDEAKLIAVDHPKGTEVYPNEMMAINAKPPKFEVFCYDKAIGPVRAVDHRGKDVTRELRELDRTYAGPTELDHRFIGIAKPHFVELDFGDRLKNISPDKRLVMFLQGWVEYGYSSTAYAAVQAGVRTEAPTIHVFRDGRWVELFREVGYPAGVRHTMTLEVTGKILPSDRRIRISGNMELYWDRIFLAGHLGDAKLKLTEASAGEADLHFRGYPREYSPDGRHPNLCDYDNMDRAVSWKLMSGNYTRYGGVKELLDKADDCFVIMGRGEEITLRFPAAKFPPVPEGYERTLMLKTDSFCKDMDLYTAHPDTVEPLPFHGMSGYPYGTDESYPDTPTTREYRRRYNTREVRAE